MKRKLLTDEFLKSIRSIVNKRKMELFGKFSEVNCVIGNLIHVISSALPMISNQLNINYHSVEQPENLEMAFSGDGSVAEELKNFMQMSHLINREPTEVFDKEFKDLFLRELEDAAFYKQTPNLLSTVDLIRLFAKPDDPIIKLHSLNAHQETYIPPLVDSAYDAGIAIYRVYRPRGSWQISKEEEFISGARLLVVPFFVQGVRTIFFIHVGHIGSGQTINVEGLQYNWGEGSWYRIESKAVEGTERILWLTLKVFFLECIKEEYVKDGWSELEEHQFSIEFEHSEKCAQRVNRELLSYFFDQEKFESVSSPPFELKSSTSSNVVKFEDHDGVRELRWLQIFIPKIDGVGNANQNNSGSLRFEFLDYSKDANVAMHRHTTFRIDARTTHRDQFFVFGFNEEPVVPFEPGEPMFFIYIFVCELLALREFKRIIEENKLHKEAAQAISDPQ